MLLPSKTAGESISCMVADLLEDTEGTTVGEHEYELKMAAFTVYNGTLSGSPESNLSS